MIENHFLAYAYTRPIKRPPCRCFSPIFLLPCGELDWSNTTTTPYTPTTPLVSYSMGTLPKSTFLLEVVGITTTTTTTTAGSRNRIRASPRNKFRVAIVDLS
ncbi:hypothetical protein M0802_003118 [Mischocyttarus mexicanus]|nr:hypothetical protein M0802_003118 [Mischocyttarus mexicanus]